MLRSLNRRVVIRLFANNIHLSLYRKWPRYLIASRQVDANGQELPELLDTAARALRESDWRGDVQLIIGNRWLRFAALPWNLQTGHPETDGMTAIALCTDMLNTGQSGTTGRTPEWTTLLDSPHYERDRLTAAIVAEHAQRLLSLSTKRNPLVSWQPWVTRAWDVFRQKSSQLQATLYVPEPGCLTILTQEKGQVLAIHQRFFAPDDPAALLSLLRMEQLQHNQPLDIMADALLASWHAQLKEFANPQTGLASSGLPPLQTGVQRMMHSSKPLAFGVTTGNRHWQTRTPLLLAMLLLASCAYLAFLTYSVEQHTRQLLEQKEELVFLTDRHEASATQKQEPLQGKTLGAIQKQLNKEWLPLLAALDKTTIRGVSLLSVTPDAEHASIRIEVESESINLAMAYIDALEKTNELDQVHLINQQPVNEKAPRVATSTQPMLQFSLQARWATP